MYSATQLLFGLALRVSSVDALSGLLGSTQATTVGFLSEHRQRRHHASACC